MINTGTIAGAIDSGAIDIDRVDTDAINIDRSDRNFDRSRRGALPAIFIALGLALPMLFGAPGSIQAQEVEGGIQDPVTPIAGEGRPLVTTPGTEDYADLGLVPGRPTVRPPRTDTPPRIDGRLDDEVWRQAALITDFVQQAPLDGAPATEDTEVYVAYDSDYLYFGFYAHYTDPSIMRASRVDRDRAPQDDLFTIYLDTFLDQQRTYDFDVNAYGVQGDGIISGNGGGFGRGGGGGIPRADRSWNALFETAGRVVEDGYTAEMAIPFKSLRYPQREEGDPHQWGFQIVREIKGKDQESDVWAPMSRDQSSFMAQMGVMEGMTNLSTSRNIEILPTFTAIQYGDIDPTLSAGPGYVNQDLDPDAGVSVKYGVTSNLIADFTVNPDFSQIESDRPQIEVNRRFPLFFNELRPFFVEGAEIFEVSAPVTFVHTRTIVDPDYGAKLTGKIGRVSLGVLAANDAAPGRVEDSSSPLFEQKAQTYILRGKFDVYSESHIGAILTDREFMDSHSRLAGIDGDLRLGATRSFNFSVIGTRHRDLDGVDTEGHLIDARIRQNARNLDWTLFGYQISPEFQTDVGFIRRTDERVVGADVSYRFWPQTWVLDWGPSINYTRNWDYDDQLQDEELGLGLGISFARNIGFNINYRDQMERFGGIDFEKTGFSTRVRVNTSRSFSFGADIGMSDQIRYSETPFLGEQVEWGVNTTIRPISRLTTRLNLSSSHFTDPRNDALFPDEGFDVKILRARSTFQFSDQLTLRNITEFNTLDETFDLNFLFTYRINAGTVFYLGYDDHYQQADLIEGDMDGDGTNEQLFLNDELKRTNRALFVKMQYLFRF